MPVATLGMRGTGSFAADERPKNWRQMILLMFPNGDTPLTAILSKLAEEPTDDPEYNWFEKGLPVYRGLIVGAIINNANPGSGADILAAVTNAEVSLSTRPDGGAAVVDNTWLAPGKLLYNENTEEIYLIINVPIAGTHVVVRRDVGDKFGVPGNNPAITGDINTGDPISIIGSAFQEGAGLGSATAFPPIRHFNYTQIFRTPLMVTRTARRTKLRWDKTGPYMEAKREALQIHATEMERAFMFGEREELTAATLGGLPFTGGTNPISTNNPARTTRGIVNWLPAITAAATPTIHWNVTTGNGGIITEPLFDAWLEEVFRFGSPEKLCFAGSTALNMLNQLAKGKMTIEAVPGDRTYGMAFNRYITPFGDLLVKQHPLMSHNSTWRKDLLVIDTAFLRMRVLDETSFLRNRQSPGDDASVDEFLTEVGLECRFSGQTPSILGGLAATPGPAVHGRLKGVTGVA